MGDVVALLLVVIAVAVIGFVGAAPVSRRLRRTLARAAVHPVPGGRIDMKYFPPVTSFLCQ
ncbi:MAG: hypothetical protein ACLP81_05375 [Acidimicrobiales bacterium]